MERVDLRADGHWQLVGRSALHLANLGHKLFQRVNVLLPQAAASDVRHGESEWSSHGSAVVAAGGCANGAPYCAIALSNHGSAKNDHVTTTFLRGNRSQLCDLITADNSHTAPVQFDEIGGSSSGP